MPSGKRRKEEVELQRLKAAKKCRSLKDMWQKTKTVDVNSVPLVQVTSTLTGGVLMGRTGLHLLLTSGFVFFFEGC